MYLGKRKVVAKGFSSGYDHLPEKLTASELTDFVKRLKEGDTSATEPIILGHLGLTIQIVGRYVSYFPLKSDDLMSVASLALTEAVHKFAGLQHDNITGYIVGTIHGRISDYLKEEDHTVKISSHGRKQALAKAKEEDSEVVFTKSYNIEFITNDKIQGARHMSRISYSVSDELEYAEIIEKCNFTRFEFLVYERLMEGMKETDIAKELHYSKQRIWQIKKDLIKKIKHHLETADEKIDKLADSLSKFWGAK